MKILINTPDLSLPGGVANHYKGLLPYWSEEVKYNFVGGRKGIPGFLMLPYDYIKFTLLCLFNKVDVVLLNPSLGKTALKRDALFLRIAKRFGIKTLIFIHGWDEEVEVKINKTSKLFQSFLLADGFFVLATEFKEKLISWGVTVPVWLTSTKVDDRLLQDFSTSQKNKKSKKLLFLARVEKNKGIYIALEAFKKVQETNKELAFQVAGSGSELAAAKIYCKDHHIENVIFSGNLNGEQLTNAFATSDIYILPTYHGEGMPTSILEAMAFGLPIVSRPVGGLVDFFENDKMGYLVESLDPQDFADKIILIINNSAKLSAMSQYNHNYAKQHFMASKVVKQLEEKIANV
ncbi:MAG: glycosyl transferase family 1 [Winogradskyella sp.]|nr:glycosyl transferase family 1 [Winogradskyella sp.]|tara:strand:- start:551 stop:1594 length:1044 start_codon:yes stop_codon:yes gene_type:complete